MPVTSLSHLQHALRRIVTRYAAHAAPASCPGPTDQQPLVGSLDSPGTDVGPSLGPRPLQRTVEDVAAGQSEIELQVDGGPCLKAEITVPVAQDDVLDGLGQDTVQRPQRRSQCDLPKGLVVRAEQPRRQVQTEQRQALGIGGCQVSTQNAAVRQCVAVDLAGD